MSLGRRAPVDDAAGDVRATAYPPGEYVQQESFATARDVLSLAKQAGVGPNTDVLDLCCGAAGFGRFLTRTLGCRYVGVDRSVSAIALARERTADLPCRFVTATIPPIPAGGFDVVLLLETVLAFRDKDALAAGIAGALRAGGRLACTVEAGPALDEAERAAMPRSETVWPVPLGEFTALLAAAGLTVTWVRDDSAQHVRVVDGLLAAFVANRSALTARLGDEAMTELMVTHTLWSRWIGTGRIRKFAVVAQKA